MPTLIVENLPREIYERIQRQAEAKLRTISEEALRLLQQGLNSPEATPTESAAATIPAAEPEQVPSRFPGLSAFILDTGEISAPCDLPHSEPGVRVPARFGGERLPEPFVPAEDDEVNNV